MLQIAFIVLAYLSGLSLVYISNRSVAAPLFVLMGLRSLTVSGALLMGQDSYLVGFYLAFGALLMGVGSFMASVVLRFRPRSETVRFRSRAPATIRRPGAWVVTLLFVTFLGLASSIILFVQEGFPLFQTNVGLSKVQIASGKGVLIRLIGSTSVMLMVWYCLTDALQRRWMKVWWWIVMIYPLVVFTLLGNKGAVFSFLLQFFIVYGLWSRDASRIRKNWIRKNKIKLIAAVVVAVGSGIIIVRLSYPGLSSGEAFVHLLRRATLGEALGVGYIIGDYVPRHGLLHGQSFLWDLDGLLGVLTRTTSQSHMTSGQFFFLTHAGVNPGNWALTYTFLGELYANWGGAIALLGMFVAGIVYQAGYIAIVRGVKHHFWLPLKLLLLAMFTEVLTKGGLFAVIANTGVSWGVTVALVIGLYTVLRFLGEVGSGQTTSSRLYQPRLVVDSDSSIITPKNWTTC